jgi:hypothetical protein
MIITVIIPHVCSVHPGRCLAEAYYAPGVLPAWEQYRQNPCPWRSHSIGGRKMLQIIRGENKEGKGDRKMSEVELPLERCTGKYH